MSRATEFIYACECEDGSVSVIVPNLKTTLDTEHWEKLHSIDSIDNLVKLQPIQVPALRESRKRWIVKDKRLKLEAEKECHSPRSPLHHFLRVFSPLAKFGSRLQTLLRGLKTPK